MKLFIKYVIAGLIGGLLTVILLPQYRALFWPHQQSVEMATHDPSGSANPATHRNETAALQPLSYADAVAKASPAVVSLRTVTPSMIYPANGRRAAGTTTNEDLVGVVGLGLGSGVIISPQGYLITNFHVVRNAETIEVQLADGRKRTAQVVGSDPESDLAVLKIELEDLPVAALRGQDEALRPGDVVMAIGNPYGYEQTVTMGIVSAVGRSTHSLSSGNISQRDLIQTDAAINPGSSGGAIINAQGDIVGISSANLALSGGGQTGINFAIPVKLARRIAEEIIQNGRVIRGWLGIDGGVLNAAGYRKLAPKVPFGVGIYVRELNPEGPAAKAGIEAGDLITHINNDLITDAAELLDRIANTRPGQQVQLKVLRSDEPLTLTATITERPRPNELN